MTKVEKARERMLELMEQNIKLIGAWIAEEDDSKRQAAEARELPIIEANIAEMDRLLILNVYGPPQQVLDSFYALVHFLQVVKSRTGP